MIPPDHGLFLWRKCREFFAGNELALRNFIFYMPKDPSIRSVLIIGSGHIIIGQACEFDYSGTQAARSLREEGVEDILINSSFEAYNLPTDTYRVRDVWAGKNLTKIKSIQALTIEPHACILWVLRK